MNNSNRTLSAYWALELYAFQGDAPLDILDFPDDAAINQYLKPGEMIRDCTITVEAGTDLPLRFEFIYFLSDPEFGGYITVTP